MFEGLLIASVLTAHHGNGPYDWHITCEQWEQKRIEVLMDEHLPRSAKIAVLGYLRSKLEKPCSFLA